MPDIKGAVTKKIGPLPLWGWVVAGAGAVFVFSRFKGGSSAGAGDANTIRIPTFAPGSPSDVGGGAVGSPSQNTIAGDNPQPMGAMPWWAIMPDWWAAGPGGGVDTANTAGGGGNLGGQSNASAGVKPLTQVLAALTPTGVKNIIVPANDPNIHPTPSASSPTPKPAGPNVGEYFLGYGITGIPLYGKKPLN
ncbi:MAG: hypothetical protein NUW01_18545 [Gemmatimonadaceae bacterium]|nr:hypothetical protein [Gemmatimonadaceae bacterium]